MYQTEYIGKSPPVFGHDTEDMVLARVGGPPVFGHDLTEYMVLARGDNVLARHQRNLTEWVSVLFPEL